MQTKKQFLNPLNLGRGLAFLTLFVMLMLAAAVFPASQPALAANNSVTVTVVDHNGAPQNDVMVYVFSGTNNTGISGMTNADGQVSFALGRGSYNFQTDSTPPQSVNGNELNNCSIPGCSTVTLTLLAPTLATVTVVDTTGAFQQGLSVYAFSGTTYTGLSGVTDGSGQVSFTLDDAIDYNFRADLNATQFWSGGASGVNTCLAICATDFVTVTTPVTVTVLDTNSAPQAGIPVYAFAGTTYSGKTGTTDVNGEVSLTLLPGDYNFRADFNGTQFWSGGASGVDTCNIPGVGLNCTTDSVTVTLPVVVTVLDTNSTPQAGVSVYAFTGTTYAGKTGVTDGNGEVSLTLLPGDYNFRADYNGTQFWSGGASGVDTCTVPGCTADAVTVTLSVAVTVLDTNSTPQAGVPVYAFNGTTYANKTGTTDVNGQVFFTLLPGDYNFRADFMGTQFFSGGASGVDTCTVPGCTTDSVTVTLPVVVTVLDSNSAPQVGVPVYAFTGTTYTGKTANTDANGQVFFILVPGDYNFRADLNGLQFFSGGASGVDTCTVPGCLADGVAVPVFDTVAVTVLDSNSAPVANQVVYLFDSTGTVYLNHLETTGASGEPASFLIPEGDYIFASDDISLVRFYSYPVCTVVGCTTASVALTTDADLAIAKTVDEALPNSGQSVVYTLTATNNGPSYATSVVVNDLLPAGAAYASDDGAGAYDSGTGDWTIGTMALGESLTLHITATVTAANNTTVDNTATISGAGLDQNPADNTALASFTVADFADLAITKSVDIADPADGDTVVYTLVATNNGPAAATSVVVTDLLPAGVTYSSDDGGGAYNSGTGEWTIGSLASGSSATLNITVTVDLNTDGDTVTNTATVTGDQNDPILDDNTASAAFTVGVNDLCATTGSITMPDGANIPIWGYAPGDCTRGLPAQLPGPVLYADEGESLSLTLHNDLSESTALFFVGQSMAPDLTGVATGGSVVYNFVADAPGTYLYQAGLLPNAEHQVAMGLFGALVVRSSTSGQAYNDPTTAYEDEAVLVLSEIDPNLNANPSGFDMRDYKPRYWLINGLAYPDTTLINTLAGNRVLLRYVNAGIDYHSMALLGLNQTVIALNGSPLTYSYRVVAETIAPGQTLDTISTIPAAATSGSQFALYDGDLILHNNNLNASTFGGMMTFLMLGTPIPGADTIGPAANGLSLSPNPTDGSLDVTLQATFSDVNRGDSNIAAAEYYIDSTSSAAIPMTPNDAFDSPTEGANSTITAATLAGLSSGNHTIYVRAQDTLGNWGPFNFVVLNLDTAGPATINITVVPVSSNGSVDLLLSATGTDQATGNSHVILGEYFIDALGAEGSGTPITPNVAAPIVSLSATITPSGLLEGAHTLYIRSQDAFGHWGAPATVSFDIDLTGPVASNISASPNPNNGTQGINSSTPAVRLTALFTDGVSNIERAEGFIDTVGADGTGFLFVATDGVFNSLSETGFVDIPLPTIFQLLDGPHTLYVHAKDIAGNWGTTSSTILMVDKTPPAISSLMSTPNPTGFNTTVDLTASASDGTTTVVQAEWYTGTDPGKGNGTPMSVTPNGPNWDLAATIDVSTWTGGDHTVFVRAVDTAGNWSNSSSVTVTVSSLYFSTVGNTNPPGVTGTADNADVYNWDKAAYSRLFDATVAGLPGAANIDGLVMVSDNQFYMSFSNEPTAIPGVGNVEDEDIVYYDNGVWSVYFDGTANGLGTSANLDLDAFDIVGGVLYFSTVGNTNPPGVGGTADDADIYSWDGAVFSRVFDASAAGLAGGADVDGLIMVSATEFYLSFNATTTTVPGLGSVEDEDIVYYNAGVWTLYFDGTANGLGTNNNLDIDAMDIH